MKTRHLFTLLVIALIFGLSAATPALAGPPAKSELTGGASYFKPDGGHSSWALAGEFAFPVSDGGHLLIGPAVQIIEADEDFQAFGAVVEFNLTGASGPFFGAAGLYDPDAPEGADEHTVNARGGFKAVIGSGGLLKFYLQKTVDGYGKSEDLTGAAMFGVRF